MNLTPELLVGISAFITSLVALFSQWRSARVAAKKEEVMLLREEVTRLQERVKTLETDLTSEREKNIKIQERERTNRFKLQEYISVLRNVLIKAGITIPEPPILE
jgi:uncharacterized protein YlxW (UPF0749 family)